MQQRKQIEEFDLKPYQPFGIPLLKLLFGLTLASLFLTASFELFVK